LNRTSKSDEGRDLPAISPYERGLEIFRQRLQHGEEINWSAAPEPKLMILDLVYRAALWWCVFTYMLPMVDNRIIVLTVILIIMLGYLEYKKRKLGGAYAITNERAIYGEFQRNGELKITELPMRNFISAKKTLFTRSINMRFREGFSNKLLRFPYVKDPLPAMQILEEARRANKLLK
jgi:hypothetical protein